MVIINMNNKEEIINAVIEMIDSYSIIGITTKNIDLQI